VTRKRRAKSRLTKEHFIKAFLNKYVLTSQTFPLICVLGTLGVMFVLFRMKGIEQDYRFSDLTKKIKIEETENKELKAERARMLSIKNLKGFAKRYKLKEPNEKHIIIIP
jgi:hypothetical protein